MKPDARNALYLAAMLCSIPAASHAQFVNPLSLIGKAVTTAADARTKEEVSADIAINADAGKRLLEDKQAQWKGVSLLTFGQHLVLAGAVKTESVKKRVAEVVRQDKRVRSLKNELVVIDKEGDGGNLVGDKLVEEKVNAALTTTKGIGSINMRWLSVNGHLVIMGVARTGEEASLAVAKARSVEGVKNVKSHLRVVAAK